MIDGYIKSSVKLFEDEKHSVSPPIARLRWTRGSVDSTLWKLSDFWKFSNENNLLLQNCELCHFQQYSKFFLIALHRSEMKTSI